MNEKKCMTNGDKCNYNKFHPALKGLQARVLYIWEEVSLTVHMYNPLIEEEDIKHFLHRFCTKVEGGNKICNSYGIWTGRRKYQVRFWLEPAAPGGIQQPPASFAISPHRGYLYYLGQPISCRKCGLTGHTKAACSNNSCRYCGSTEHVAVSCHAPRQCSLCGGQDHLYRSCHLRTKSFAGLFASEGADKEGSKRGGTAAEGHSQWKEGQVLALELQQEDGEGQLRSVEDNREKMMENSEGESEEDAKEKGVQGKEGDGELGDQEGEPVGSGLWLGPSERVRSLLEDHVVETLSQEEKNEEEEEMDLSAGIEWEHSDFRNGGGS